MNLANLIGGVILLVSAAVLAALTNLALVPLIFCLLLALVGLLVLFSADDKSRALAAKWWGTLRNWFRGSDGWALWEAIALGLVIFGIFAGVEFLSQVAVILAAFLAPWLAGLWSSRRGTQLPALLSTLAGAVVGLVEGRFFLAWLPVEWNDFPAWLLAMVVAGLVGAALGFWACARGHLKVAKQA